MREENTLNLEKIGKIESEITELRSHKVQVEEEKQKLMENIKEIKQEIEHY